MAGHFFSPCTIPLNQSSYPRCLELLQFVPSLPFLPLCSASPDLFVRLPSSIADAAWPMSNNKADMAKALEIYRQHEIHFGFVQPKIASVSFVLLPSFGRRHWWIERLPFPQSVQTVNVFLMADLQNVLYIIVTEHIQSVHAHISYLKCHFSCVSSHLRPNSKLTNASRIIRQTYCWHADYRNEWCVLFCSIVCVRRSMCVCLVALREVRVG